MDILITGGTVFVSRFAARYFADRGHRVTVLNRGTRPQEPGVELVSADRRALTHELSGRSFDAVLDITAYTRADVEGLHRGLSDFGSYILISSSAVYPETNPRPFREDQRTGPNTVWGGYGLGKIGAEEYVLKNIPGGYILRPPYLCGRMNNLYREAFVFDCAREGRPFALPENGGPELQFFDVEDLCRFMEILLERNPGGRVFNLGNPGTVTSRRWAEACYALFGQTPEFWSVGRDVPVRSYFPFADYTYELDIRAMSELIPETKPLDVSLKESLEFYMENPGEVRRKPYWEFLDRYF